MKIDPAFLLLPVLPGSTLLTKARSTKNAEPFNGYSTHLPELLNNKKRQNTFLFILLCKPVISCIFKSSFYPQWLI